MNELKIKKGFTLVELIIVITILVILATIAFVSFQNYTKDTRDSNRLMTIKNIQNGLEGFQIKTGIYPEPENSINILAGTSTISKQGYFGESQSDIINIDKLPIDPLDGTKYIYSINNNKNKYQLLSYLEANSQLSFINETYADDLTKRNIKSFGNKLGIVLNENSEIITQNVDIVNSTGVYKVILDNSSSGTFIGTGLVLSETNPTGSCKRILETGSNKDGVYKINPLGGDGFDVYCDMTTDGGGWTLVARAIAGSYMLSIGSGTTTIYPKQTIPGRFSVKNIILFSKKINYETRFQFDNFKDKYFFQWNNGHASSFEIKYISNSDPAYKQSIKFNNTSTYLNNSVSYVSGCNGGYGPFSGTQCGSLWGFGLWTGCHSGFGRVADCRNPWTIGHIEDDNHRNGTMRVR